MKGRPSTESGRADPRCEARDCKLMNDHHEKERYDREHREMLSSGSGFLPRMAIIVSAGFVTEVTIRRYRRSASAIGKTLSRSSIHNADKDFNHRSDSDLTNGLHAWAQLSSRARRIQAPKADFSPFRHMRDNRK